MASLSTERAVSLSRGDSTDNLLAADLSPPEVLLEPSGKAGLQEEEPAASTGASPRTSSLQSACKNQSISPGSSSGATAAARPLLTAPSFDQRPAPDLVDASPWSSTETSCRSRKNSVNLLDCWNQGNSNNNNTLAINQRLGDVAVRTAPPSQSSVDSAIISTAAGIIAGCGGQPSRNNRSVPDIELHYRRGNSDERVCSASAGDHSPRLYNRHGPHHSQSSFSPHHHPHSTSPSHHHHTTAHASPHYHHQYRERSVEQSHLHSPRYHPLHPQASHPSATSSRPRVCEHQPFSFSLSRATSRESVRSAVQSAFYGQPDSSLRLPSQLVPETAVSPASTGSTGWANLRGEMLRQHSQPETSCYHCHNPSASLRQLKESSGGSSGGGGCDIAGIAADTLRINGAIRQFRQVAFPVGHSFTYKHPCALFLNWFFFTNFLFLSSFFLIHFDIYNQISSFSSWNFRLSSSFFVCYFKHFSVTKSSSMISCRPPWFVIFSSAYSIARRHRLVRLSFLHFNSFFD